MRFSTIVPTVTLNNGVEMPQLGFGTIGPLGKERVAAAVTTALEVGYRSIDSATKYQNERFVGLALKNVGIARDEVFVTTKVWESDHGRDATLRAFDVSLAELGLEYIDLYLIHFPAPAIGLYVETWLALEELYREGRVRAIGVANFEISHLSKVLSAASIAPAINQIEVHPRLPQKELRAFNESHTIKTEAWSPLGMGVAVREPTIASIAAARGATVAQVILRWHLQQGTVVIPRSENPTRIRENLEAVSLAPLDEEELAIIDSLDSGVRVGPHPNETDKAHDYKVAKEHYERIMLGLE